MKESADYWRGDSFGELSESSRTRRSVKVRDVWLPFEGDTGLSIILSKAIMLAADTRIADPLFVSQIRRT